MQIIDWQQNTFCTLQMFTGHYGVFTSFPCSGETLQYLEIVGKSYHCPGVSPQSVNITGFIHNIHRVSLWFLHPFSIDSAGFLCRDPVIPWHPKILADQLTLYQPRGTNYAHRVIQIFRPSYGPGYFFFFHFLNDYFINRSKISLQFLNILLFN